jgi:outer membrane lipoprotein-sorting protein
MTLEARGKKVKRSGEATLMKPNFGLIEYDAPATTTILADGKNVWTLFPELNHFARRAADENGLTIAAGILPLAVFYGAPVPGVGRGTTRYIGKAKVQGRLCDVIEVTTRRPVPGTTRLTIGPDHVIYRAVQEFRSGGDRVKVRTELAKVRVDAQVNSTQFICKPLPSV